MRTRFSLLHAVFLLLPLPAAVQCYRMQVLQADHWQERAEGTRRRIEFLLPRRGAVLARSGGVPVPLAVESAVHALYARLQALDPYLRAVDAAVSACRLSREEAVRALEERDQGRPILRFVSARAVPPERMSARLRRARGVQVLPRGDGTCELHIDPELPARRDRVLARAAALLGAELDPLLQEVRRGSLRAAAETNAYQRAHDLDTPILLLRDVPFDAVVELEEYPEVYTGLEVRFDALRRYPLGRTAAHVLGYTGLVNRSEARELRADGRLLEYRRGIKDLERFQAIRRGAHFMTDRIGRMGLESEYETELAGLYGARIVEKDAAGRERRVLFLDPPVHGRDLVVTLDLAAQAQAEYALAQVCEDMERRWATDPDHLPREGVAASVVVLDVATGAVVVMASCPDYDPARPGDLRPGEDSYMNRGLRAAYPPGSAFKPITAVAACDAGLVDPSDRRVCNGRFHKASRGFACRNHGHGLALDMSEALMRSCNDYFYEMGDRLGGYGLARSARRMGLGAPTGVDLGGELGGLLPDPAWKRRALGEPWYPGDSWNMGIGQGALLVTPLQVARAYAMLANGGRPVTPYLVEGMGLPPGDPVVEVPRSVLDGLRQVVEEVGGTAYRVGGLRELGVAGKTGTAQAGGHRYHAWFAGFAPHEDPRYAMAVCVESVPKGLSGGRVAGPVAARVFDALLAR